MISEILAEKGSVVLFKNCGTVGLILIMMALVSYPSCSALFVNKLNVTNHELRI
jgi:hypothetical protein